MRREAAAERGSSTASPPDVPSTLIVAAADATDRDNLDRNSNARDAAGDVTLVCGNDEVFEARHLLVQHFRAKVGKLSNPKVVKVDFEHISGSRYLFFTLTRAISAAVLRGGRPTDPGVWWQEGRGSDAAARVYVQAICCATFLWQSGTWRQAGLAEWRG